MTSARLRNGVPNRGVLVTGCSSGISDGQRRFTWRDRGFTVFATVRKESDAEELRALGESNLIPAGGGAVAPIELMDLAGFRLIREIVDSRERLDHTLTREEFKEYFDEIMRGQDEIMKIVLRLDQHRFSRPL